MRKLYSRLCGLVVAGVAVIACAPVAESAPTSSLASSPEASVSLSQKPALSAHQDTGQTRVRFSVNDAEIIVRIADNPTSRDFLSMLPLTMSFRDFNAMEKVGDLPRKPTTEGSVSTTPANGDLIHFVPWGNLGFFYDAARRDTSFDRLVFPIGTVESGFDRLGELESGPVRVELIP
jgi:hypothetical protein